MPRRSKEGVLHIGVRRLDLYRHDGSHQTFALSSAGDQWSSVLFEVGKILQDAAIPRGTGLHVLYRSPTQVVQLTPHGKIQALQDSIEAARLAALNAAGALPDAVVSAASPLYARCATSVDDSSCCIILAAADRVDTIEQLAELLAEHHLRLASLQPVEATLASAACRHLSVGQGFTLHVGMERSVLLAAPHGAPALARFISIGMDDLVDALCKPIHAPVGPPMTSLSPQEAREILLVHGLPARDDAISVRSGLTGAMLLPLIQPILQRMLMEIRQTLRFGLSEQSRSSLKIIVTGPGSAIRGLDATIAEGLEADVQKATCSTDATARADVEHSSVNPSILNIEPPSIASRRFLTRVRTSLVAGAVLAIAGLVAESLHVTAQTSVIQQEAQRLTRERDESLRQAERALRAAAVSSRLQEIKSLAHSAVSVQCDWTAVLLAVSEACGEHIRLASVQARSAPPPSEPAGTLMIEGFAFDDDDASSPDGAALTRFLADLRDSPLLADVRLGEVQQFTLDTRRASRFNLTLGVRAVEKPTILTEAYGLELSP